MNIEYIRHKLKENGEIHLVVEEHESVLGDSEEDYIGLRNGDQTTFDVDNNVIEIDTGNTVHIIDADRVVYIHGANEFPD